MNELRLARLRGLRAECVRKDAALHLAVEAIEMFTLRIDDDGELICADCNKRDLHEPDCFVGATLEACRQALVRSLLQATRAPSAELPGSFEAKIHRFLQATPELARLPSWAEQIAQLPEEDRDIASCLQELAKECYGWGETFRGDYCSDGVGLILRLAAERDTLKKALAHLLAEWEAWNPGLTGVARERARAALAGKRSCT